ncbi:MAG: glycosyltransferase family 2 protein [Desulfococcaceae bacterium]|jgi:glycosyltransferase involved in cell wall biosynthesis|nr:glycosyltransferase family 2 protein [Desulfococcaceae bacterium]
MYKKQSICVVIPAYNEAKQIAVVLDSMPDYVDRIIIVDDKSTDNTAAVVQNYRDKNEKILLIRHEINQGCGGALATGYKQALQEGFDVAVRMDGDGQMNPEDLPLLLEPVVDGTADYAKGNRLVTGEAYRKMPPLRYFGNAFLSLLTKIVSGYWHVADFQSGYTAMNRKVLETIDWNRMYKRYGQPNDLLIRLNVYNFRVKDVPVKPVYNIGEQSGMKIKKVLFTISWLLTKMFFWRMKEKYIIRDFHPLIFFYALGGMFGIATIILFIRLLLYWIFTGHIPSVNALAAMFSFMSASQFILFGMWFDMEANKELK